MKKIILLLVVCFSAFMISGCGKEKTMNCSRTINQNGIKMDLSYSVTYKGKYAKVVKSVEKITTEDEDALENYKTKLEETTKSFKEIEYYDHDIKIEGNTLTSSITIDYEKIDTDKLISIDSAMKQIIKDGKVSIDTLESLYTELGNTCER